MLPQEHRRNTQIDIPRWMGVSCHV